MSLKFSSPSGLIDRVRQQLCSAVSDAERVRYRHFCCYWSIYDRYNCACRWWTLALSPYIGTGTGLPNATAAFAPPGDVIKWQCMAAGATTIVAGISRGTLPASYTPADCR